jgi:hypothetical protein
VVHRSQLRSIQDMVRVLTGLPDRFEVCYEASCGYGHFHDLLRPLATRVVAAHPGQLRLIFRSKHKNDRNDAERPAKLLYLGEAPAVHVPSLEVRTWRELINCRRQVIAKRTRAKNTARALLRSAGVTPPKNPGPWTKKGLAWLRQLALPTASQQLRRDLLLEEIEGLIRQVRRVEQQLSRQAQQTPTVARLRTSCRDFAASVLATGGSLPPPGPPLASSLLPGMVPDALERSDEGSTSRPRAGLRLHPEVRHGAMRRRWCEWGQPHTLSWRAASAADAEWMSG